MLLIVISNAFCQEVDQFSIKHYTSKNGLPQNSIRSMVMDNDRFIWLTTEGGLVRFDGQFFKVYNHNNTSSIQNDRFVSVIKTMNEKFIAYDQAKSTFEIVNGNPVLIYTGDRRTPPQTSITGSIPDPQYLINTFKNKFVGYEYDEIHHNQLLLIPN